VGEGGLTQADRDEAAGWIAGLPYDVVKAEAEMIRIGQLDNHRLVQAFARHRQAAEKATRDKCAKVADDRAEAYHAIPRVNLLNAARAGEAERIATAIRSQNDG
jgi:hypothetical protein